MIPAPGDVDAHFRQGEQEHQAWLATLVPQMQQTQIQSGSLVDCPPTPEAEI